MVYNYQVFQNVATKEDFLGNIKNVAITNGWVCDKDNISATGELYLHSLGNGNQNLYYSFKVQVISWGYSPNTRTATAIRIFANTGFDTNLTVDAQPGKWSQTTLHVADTICFSLLGFPMSAQYVFANSQMVLCFYDIFTSVFQPFTIIKPRLIKHLGFGAIDSYKGGSETEGNYLFTDWYYNFYGYTDTNNNCFFSSILGTVNTYMATGETPYNYAGVLYRGIDRFDINCGVSTPNIIGIYSSIQEFAYNNYCFLNLTARQAWNSAYGRKGYRYSWAIQYNSWASRFSLIKPILSISYSDTTNIYFYPIGELPYYACKAYPYTQTGSIVYYGARKFMVFPILYNENNRGVAVEIV